MPAVDDDELPLQRAYRWERERARRVFLTQPFGGGKIRHWTWAQAMDESRRIAAHLKAQGWEPGSRIGILSKNSAWWIMADLAIWMAGHVSVPVFPSLQAQTVRQILEHSGARACFIGPTDERETALDGVPAGIARIYMPNSAAAGQPSWDAVAAANAPLAGQPARASGDIATIIYTSGTTGAPKGAMHTFAGLSFAAWTLTRRFALNDGHRLFSYLPLAHIFERGALEATALFRGFHIFFTEGLDTFVADLQRARPTVFLSVPRLLAKFQEGVLGRVNRRTLERLIRIPVLNRVVKKRILSGLGLDAVQVAACGGAPLAPDLLLWYRRLGLDLAEGYGTTETMITHVPAHGQVRPGYVGDSVEGVETKLGPGGEVLVRSPMNMLGYYRDPEATRAAFTEDGFVRSGDLGEIAPDRQLRLVGRIKDQFKTSKGKYVAPAPLEIKLLAHPALESCCLIGSGLARPFAVVLLTAEASKRCVRAEERAALEQSLAAHLDAVNAGVNPHERISFIAIADGPWSIANGLLTPTFKLKRSVLEARYQAFFDKWAGQGRNVVWESAPAAVHGTAA